MIIVKISKKLWGYLYIYRYDIFSLIIMSSIILWMMAPIYRGGHIVFSDMAFGFSSQRYMEEIFGLWNERWSTSTLLNVPRLIYIYPLYFFSKYFNYSGAVLIKSFITVLVLVSAISMYLFTKRIISIYFSKEFNFFKVFALITGAIFYALNPWVVMRLQHIYLLCGYSLLPIVLMFFFNAFDPKFQQQLIPGYYIYHRGIYKRNVFDLFMLSIFFTISAAAIHYFFYGMIFLFILGVLIVGKTLIQKGNRSKRKIKSILINTIKKIAVFATLFTCLSGYWLSAYFGSIVLKAQASQHNINVIDTLSLFSRNSSIKNVVYFISYWWPMFNISELPLSFYIGGAVTMIFVLYGVLYKGYKYNIIVFFTICTLGFSIVSTGVKLESFANIFIIIVSKTPIIGSMFRDPNKFIGLMAVGYSVLLTFGVQSFLIKLDAMRRSNILKTVTFFSVVIAFSFYFRPFYDHFINGFYSPITIPQEYSDVQDKFKDKEKFDSKVLYMPIADNMIQSFNGVATPYWNRNSNNEMEKATGDIQVYSSQKNTIFHHEGNAVSITYYMNFLQYLLDKGMTKNFGNLVSTFGINEFAYHNEYVGQEARQKFNLEILKQQDGLKKTYENGIFSLYDVETPIPYLYNVPKKIITPYGYSRLESYSNVKNFNFSDYGVIFSALGEKSYLETLNNGDYIDVADYNDLFLSNLPKDNYLLPFDVINEGNSFLTWSKTLVNNNDWLWYLSSQNLNNFPFEFDFNSGVAVTFASSRLDIPPYKIDYTKGKLIADFDSMLRTDRFFVPDNPEIFSVSANPRTNNNSIPVLHGEIMKGDPKNIWQVAKSGLLDAKENNPYKFNLVVSGRGTNKMHVKVRFFDKQMKEIGVSYVVAPGEEVDFNEVNFTGEYVSPQGSAYMRIDLLSYQQPEQKNYWWIHDIKIYDFDEYKKPNVFTMTKKFDSPQRAKVYMRTLYSAKGGDLQININNSEAKKISTMDNSITQFKWIEVGDYDFAAGENKISVENKSGFNAINIFAIIPEKDYSFLSNPLKVALNKCNIFSVLEAENDFSYSGNIQSERVYPKLSMGKGISSQKGILERDLDIVKTSNYSFAFKLNGGSDNDGKLTFSILNEQNELVLKRQINNSDLSETSNEKEVVVDKIYNTDTFPQTIKYIDNMMGHYNTFLVNNINLVEGKYKVRIEFDSNVFSLSNLNDIHKFESTEVALDYNAIAEEVDKEDIGNYIGITSDMMRDSIVDNTLNIEYDKTFSNSWYDYASKKVLVKPDEEYLINFDAVSQNVSNRHMKVVFIDKDDKVINTTYINDIEDKYKSTWNSYEQIVKAPTGAKYMQFHILCQGSKVSNGFVKIKNYTIIPYKDLITFDNMMIFEGNDFENFFKSDIEKNEIKYSRLDSMKREFQLTNSNRNTVLLNYCESPNPLWEISLGSFKERGTMTLNGVTTGIVTDESGKGKIEVILRKVYYGSFMLIGVGIIIFVVLYKKSKR
ncbi:membrane protein [Clostridium cellulovorans]|uniref:Uncharacterized protein n=1 Tax=Clostridium cellulovorans (strain ATCC 35296 / DSM 3052 / OCM 3 / 743B) TaxID=573061 RepID=D9STB9_CLOC7|nr:membrane protein [Clostridium cellulovorans]ADL50735.1 hypothetical protein Clocel_0969 [Clostridium cellulovorans 743B]